MIATTLCVPALGKHGPPPYWRGVSNDLSTKILSIRRALGLNQVDFAKRLRVNQATVSRWEKGSVPDANSLADIAELGGIDLPTLIGADFSANAMGPRLFVKGEVQAGVWREAFEWPQEEWVEYQGGEHIASPDTSRFGLRVVGESMDQVYPPGTLLDCVNNIHSPDELRSGQRVIVLRRRHDGEVEATVKELLRNDAGNWLIPRSNNPAFQVPINLDDDDPAIEETTVIAVVRGSYRPE